MLYTIQNSVLTVTVADHGAELQSILGPDGTEYLWQGDPAYWKDRAINLFPYVARLTEGTYELDGQRYHMDIHGLAPYRTFRLTEQAPDRLCLELTDTEETYGHYPRHFAFRIRYVLRENTLEITYEVENRDDRTMYFGLGGHPGFRVPLAEGRRFEDYRLRFADPCEPRRVRFTPACFRTGETTPFSLQDGTTLPLRHDLFNEDAIVLEQVSPCVTLEAEGEPHYVTVRFPQMPYLGIWHMPKTDAPYVCLEPWCSLPSKQDEIAVLEEQADLLRLPAGETYRNRWQITIA